MPNKPIELPLSSNFKKQTIKAIAAILLFIVVYIGCIIFALGLTLFFGYLGVMIIKSTFHFITLVIGLGLISIGLLVLFFLIKFIFSKSKSDRSHLVEITKDQQPALFALIKEIVQEVDTNFPKRVYLSADVNAAVFYDSSFWSMFFPVRKNLIIGMGVINSVTVNELKAILAHEFGHFSQKSMKVGSFVYNVNQILHSMLFDNFTFRELAVSFASISGFFTFFVNIGFHIINALQVTLKEVYEIVNLQYLALSREMEYHADEIAARVAGSKSLSDGLLRIELSNVALTSVISFYYAQIMDSIKSKNIFPEQTLVLHFLAEQSHLTLTNNLPKVELTHLNQYNKSKLIIDNQWSSHPSTNDRINRLDRLNIVKDNPINDLANSLLLNKEMIQEEVTKILYEEIPFTKTPKTLSLTTFKEHFEKEYFKHAYDPIFNKYYNNRNPVNLDLENINEDFDKTLTIKDLFSDELADKVYILLSINADMTILQEISQGLLKIKTFDYDGLRYSSKDCPMLIDKMKVEIQFHNQALIDNDKRIHLYFKNLAVKQNQYLIYEKLLLTMYKMSDEYDENMEIANTLNDSMAFIQDSHPLDELERKMEYAKELEYKFRMNLKKRILTPAYFDTFTEEMTADFEKYLRREWTYFENGSYNEGSLGFLYKIVTHFNTMITQPYLIAKKELLNFMVELEKRNNNEKGS